MTTQEENRLINLVLAMRSAQILYFQTRKQEDLINAKTLERAADEWIADYRRKYGG